MGYIDPQDRARQREEALREAHNEELGVQRAALVDRDVRGRGMFVDERRHYVDELVRVDLNATKGYVPPHELEAAKAEVWAVLEPIIYEKPDRPLSVSAVKELVAGVQRGPVSEARRGQLVDYITATRTKVFETKASKTAELSALNQEMVKQRPRLNAFCNRTGAGDSVPLIREMLAESAERAPLKATTSARPFRALLGPAPGPAVGPAPGTVWPVLVRK
jgi:hypothetical protein